MADEARITQAGIQALVSGDPEARVTQAGVMALTAPDSDLRVTQAGIMVLRTVNTFTPPDTPTLTIDPLGILTNGANWSGSIYNSTHTPPSPQADCQIQVDDTDATFSSLVVDVTYGLAVVSGSVTGLAAGTQHWARLRYKDGNGQWSSWSSTVTFTTNVAGVGTPNQAVLSVTTGPAETWVELSTTAYSHDISATTYPHGSTELQVATDAGFTSLVYDATGASALGPVTSKYVFGLTQNTPHFARARWVDGFGQPGLWSATLSFTTATAPGARPATPTLTVGTPSVNQVDLTSSAFSGGTGTHASSSWQVANNSSFGPGTIVAESLADAVNLLSWTAIGLAPGTQYWARLLHTDDDTPLGADSLWSSTQTFTTTLDIEAPLWTFPLVGAAIRGANTLTWSISSPEGDATYQIDYSADGGATWSSIAAAATGTSEPWDVSALADGTYIIRIRQESVSAADESIWVYTTVFVDNGLDVALTYVDSSATDANDWTQLWDTYKTWWDQAGYLPVGQWKAFANPGVWHWPLWRHGPGVLSYDPALQPTEFDLVAEVEITGQRGGFKWAAGYDVELCGAGVAGRASGVSSSYSNNNWPTLNQHGIAAYVYLFPASTAFSPVIGKGPGFLTIKILDGTAAHWHQETVPLGFDLYTSDAYLVPGQVLRPYNLRLRVTQIRDNGDGTEDLRVQVGLYGHEVAPHASGWVYDKSFTNVPKQCGGVGYLAEGGSGQSYSNTGSKDFRSMGVRGIAYDTCSAPPGFTPPALGSGCAPPIFDLTIMDGTEEAAIVGSYVNGQVVEASFSTDPTHPRPYLSWAAEDGPRITVDPLSGSSTIGQVTPRILDKRSDPCDWSTAALTQLLGDALGESAINGHRALLRERLGDGVTWRVIMDGHISRPKLDANLVEFSIQIRDWRERERVPVFTTPSRRDPTTGVIEPTSYAFPPGPAKDYGKLTYQQNGATVNLVQLAATAPATGTFNQYATGPNGEVYGWIVTNVVNQNILTDDHLAIGNPVQTFDVNGVDTGLKWSHVGIMWRPVGDPTWRIVEDMVVPDQQYNPLSHYVNGMNVFLMDSQNPSQSTDQVVVQLTWEGPPLVAPPTPGQQVEFYVYPKAPPSPSFPLYWDEGTLGDLLKEIYDGAFGPIDPRLRYDVAQMALMQANTPAARLKVEEPVEDMREWVEEHIYAAAGWVPARNAAREICPVDTNPPAAGVSLTTLDDTNTISGTWEQDDGQAVHIVDYNWTREHVEQILASDQAGITQLTNPGRLKQRRRFWFDKEATPAAGNILIGRPVNLTWVSAYASTASMKPRVFEPATVRTFGGQGGVPVFAAAQSGAVLANARIQQLKAMYPTGPELVNLTALNTAEVRSLKVGDFVILDLDWIPNLSTNDRGGTQLALLVDSQKRGNLTYGFTLLIVGGNQTGLTQPTIGTPTVGTNFHVSVPVTTVPASTTTVVQAAVSPTQPADDSGLWQEVGRQTSSSTTVRTAPILPDNTVWTRARSEQAGYRASAWTTPASTAVTGPAVTKVGVSIHQDGSALLEVQSNGSTLGLLVEWEVHDPGLNPSYPNANDLELDAAAGGSSGFDSGFSSGFGGPKGQLHLHELTGASVPKGKQLSVRVTPYDGWTGSAVSGTAGVPMRAADIQTRTVRASGFSSGFDSGFGATDPAEQIGGSGAERLFVQVSSAYTLAISDRGAEVDASGGAVTITLPPAADANGLEFTVTKADSSGNAVTLDGDGSELISGSLTWDLLSQWDSATFISTGSAWVLA